MEAVRRECWLPAVLLALCNSQLTLTNLICLEPALQEQSRSNGQCLWNSCTGSAPAPRLSLRRLWSQLWWTAAFHRLWLPCWDRLVSCGTRYGHTGEWGTALCCRYKTLSLEKLSQSVDVCLALWRCVVCLYRDDRNVSHTKKFFFKPLHEKNNWILKFWSLVLF